LPKKEIKLPGKTVLDKFIVSLAVWAVALIILNLHEKCGECFCLISVRRLCVLMQNILVFTALLTSLFPRFLGCEQYDHYYKMKALHCL
jgi:hypothetical protein